MIFVRPYFSPLLEIEKKEESNILQKLHLFLLSKKKEQSSAVKPKK